MPLPELKGEQTAVDSLIKLFLQSYEVRGRAKRTVEEMERRLGSFKKYLSANRISHIDEITQDVVKSYQTYLYHCKKPCGSPYAVTHQNLLLGAAKQFTRYLNESGYLVSDPAQHVRYAREPKRLPSTVLTQSEARKILQVPDTKCLLGYRNKTILEVLYSTGIRSEELIHLTLGDVDCHDGFLLIRGKGGRERIVPVGKIACCYLEKYIAVIRPELVKDERNIHVFLSVRGNKLSRNGINDFIRIYTKQAGIRKNVHCHTFRHTCATLMLKNKADIRIIQELLGHVSLDTTQVYTHLAITDLKDIHKKCHPREKDPD